MCAFISHVLHNLSDDCMHKRTVEKQQLATVITH